MGCGDYLFLWPHERLCILEVYDLTNEQWLSLHLEVLDEDDDTDEIYLESFPPYQRPAGMYEPYEYIVLRYLKSIA